MDGASELVHATAIAVRRGEAWRAALIRGPSGAGKSDLALRCLAAPRSALLDCDVALVADDQVRLTRRAGALEATCPPAIRGRLEVRGIGLVPVRSIEPAGVDLIVDLVPRGEIPRLPDPPPRAAILGVTLPRLLLSAFDASAPIKLLIALRDPALLGGADEA